MSGIQVTGQHRDDGAFDTILRLLWRRWRTVISPALVLMAMTLIAGAVMPRHYTATSVIMLDRGQPENVTGVAGVNPALPREPVSILGEIEVLRSPALISALIKAEDLENDPEFVPALALQESTAWLDGFLAALKPEPDPIPAGASPALHTVRKAISVNQMNRALVIGISVSTREPAKSARLSNRLVELYLEHQRQARTEAVMSVSSFLNDRLENLRQAVNEADAKVTVFRSTHGLGQNGEISLAAQQRTDLNNQLVQARTTRVSTEARLERLRLAANHDDLENMPDVLLSPTVQNLKAREAELSRTLADLNARYGEKHPYIRDTRAQLEDLRRRITSEAITILRSMENEASIARIRERSLTAELRDLENQRQTEGEAMIQLRELEREAETSRALYQTFMMRMKETGSQAGLDIPDTRVVSRAPVPDRPGGTPRGALVIASFFVGLLPGLVLAILVERLDRKLRHPRDIPQKLGLHLAGLMPRETAAPRNTVPPGSTAEELRALIARVWPAGDAPGPSILGVTSTLPGEGKTTLVYRLGQVLARSGRKVLLVDADLRRPALTPLATGNPVDPDHSSAPNLMSVLAGTQTPESSIICLQQNSLFLLPGAIAGAAAPDLLEGPGFMSLLRYMQDNFDIVLLDAPPVMPVADARVMARFCQTMLFAVRWESTPDDAIQQALELLDASGAGVPLMAVMTMIDLRKQATYGYGGYRKHYSAYQEYYAY
ncbi:polysaccharide biosynthesis tyrosine autokinase [Haematospirillum jordaniae]|uniref:non-specific protein-tyrosine kinase n=1 Tax=Haematospirillum jordaniae TaxID=1549855 RepID=A0A143DFU4_9PROT|nr:polysaccharide biosynthesis tyrosine autokinase [Haematospirillum jordaniae]AMW35429.1 hypothetical protein AY555_09850 [Haematospirillum jordaniae]NKD45572.1 polysaccharide biosynthesis tyrosine autokinase [Haematospirillum jordaniae]NKD56132.1 polysaccharide biosynthesis tyrosine autokinase [Haematospirillum jordaniae]NKD58190.1 polysaccharide biosynthesis tyrosine autokinase [Haematospirillum jordaniae]NKD66639.1 polysaccharide biosynthesis tyrosine autokinase [Haematospirillum jordaniae